MWNYRDGMNTHACLDTKFKIQSKRDEEKEIEGSKQSSKNERVWEWDRDWDRETEIESERERGWKREGILMECDNRHKGGQKGAKLVVDRINFFRNKFQSSGCTLLMFY